MIFFTVIGILQEMGLSQDPSYSHDQDILSENTDSPQDQDEPSEYNLVIDEVSFGIF